MGRASQRKRLSSSERGPDPPRARNVRRKTTHLAWWLGALSVVVVVVALALLDFRPGTPSNSDGGQAASDQTPFATTGGEMSLADLRGSKVVLYFYEGAG
jgi:hypothetical protein